ncbi:MAG: response regulator transcription factor [Acidiferrobacteraceae bacterium]
MIAGRLDAGKTLLLVDDDATFCNILAKALTRRGFEVFTACDVGMAEEIARSLKPAYAVVDLRIPGASGLTLIPGLRTAREGMRILILTGYASVATAVRAIKLGATNYLMKPANADEIVNALLQDLPLETREVASDIMSVDRLEWEHIHRVLMEHNGNLSATARSLKMHRRTLQRKLSKHPLRH